MWFVSFVGLAMVACAIYTETEKYVRIKNMKSSYDADAMTLYTQRNFGIELVIQITWF